MFRRVLVGIDEETRGRDALALALTLASDTSEITLAHVHPTLRAATNVLDEHVDFAAATRQLLTSVAADSGLHARTKWTGAATVGAGLRTIAEEIDADLLVLGATNRNKLTRAVLGNPTTETLANSGCVVAVSPAGYAERACPIKRVGVAYDGSQESEAALDLARRVARMHDAEVSAFNAVPTFQGNLAPTRQTVEHNLSALKAARERMNTHKDVEPHVALGDAVKQLGSYSATVDVLVAGSRGPGILTHLTRRSTTAALTGVVKCPLLVVTKGARDHQNVGADASGSAHTS